MRSRSYRQHRPEETPLFSLVKEHLPSFIKASERTYKSGLPKKGPRATNAEHHIKPWSDAPNIALLRSLHPGATAQQKGISQEPDGMPPMSEPFQNDRDHRDEIPPADSYFQEEVPPD